MFQAISLADEIIVRSLKQPKRIEIDGVFDCPPDKTTIFKAIVAFREATGIQEGISIQVKKLIPAGGGLGGGSSDAAAVLVALDRLFETGLSLDELIGMGESIGSDVPFFFSGGAAIVTGRGEEVDRVEARTDFSLVLVFPGFPMNTKIAYELLDKRRPLDSAESDPSRSELLESYHSPIKDWIFHNSFETFIGDDRPIIPDYIKRLKDNGAAFASLSGSGSTFFGVFEKESLARLAADRLRRMSDSDFLIATAFPLARAIALI